MDNDPVKKFMTFKSGNFVFSSKHNASELHNILFEARLLYATIGDLPVLPSWATYLEEELIRRSIFSTAAIEGNPLKEEDVKKIIDQADFEQKDSEARRAIVNLRKAYDYVKKIEQPKTGIYEVTEDLIKNCHRIITDGLNNTDNLPGQYRNHLVKVGDEAHGGIYTPPKCQADIVNLMKEFIKWINSKEVTELDSLLRASLAHYHLGLIHPFGDGNGRTIRLLEAVLLRTSGIKYVPTMLSNYYYRNVDNYYLAFSFTRKNKEHDVTMFLKFTLEGVVDSLKEIKDNITFSIRRLVMRDYLAFLRNKKSIVQRQHDLLCLLLDSGKAVSLKDLFTVTPYNTLYRNVSERTARRDLSTLLERGLLSYENGYYTLDLKLKGLG